MKDVLITLGDSFTYGQGLPYEYIKNHYPEFFQEIFKIPQNVLGHKISKLTGMIKDFDKYRYENNYSFFLSQKLNSQLITIGENGGRNVERLMNLDFIIENLSLFKISIPKYIVFQFTHVGRDIEDILLTNDRTEKYVNDIYGNSFITKVRNGSVDGKTAWDLDLYFEEATEIFIEELEKRFESIERKFGTKCIFFLGLGDTFIIKKIYQKLLVRPHFMEISHQGVIYYTWLEMNEKLKLNLRSKIGVPDDHPSSDSHKIISDKLYERLKNGI